MSCVHYGYDELTVSEVKTLSFIDERLCMHEFCLF